MSTSVSKITAERNQRILQELVTQPGNDVCADCKSRAPRWASHNLGIFLCVRCASIHRKIGTHISKVKSLSLDQWTKEQVENMKLIGNVKANEYWNPDERRNPVPTNLHEAERDSELEKFIRAKYEHKRFLDKKATVEAKLGPSRSKNTMPPRSQTAPLDGLKQASRTQSKSPVPPLPPSPAPPAVPPKNNLAVPNAASIPRSASTGSSFRPTASPAVSVPPRTNASTAQSVYQAQPQTAPVQSSFNPFPQVSVSQAPPIPQGQTWNDLVSLQGPSINATLPLQYQSYQQQAPAPSSSPFIPSQSFGTPTLGAGANPYANISSSAGLTGSFQGMGVSQNPTRSATLPPPTFNSHNSFSAPSSATNPMGFSSPNSYQSPQQPSFMSYNSHASTFASSPTTSPYNPFNSTQQQQFMNQSTNSSPFQSNSPFGLQQPQLQHSSSSSSLSPFQPHSASPYGHNAFGAGQSSPSPLSQAYSMPPASAPATAPNSQFAQQAQAVFQSMTNNNPFAR